MANNVWCICRQQGAKCIGIYSIYHCGMDRDLIASVLHPWTWQYLLVGYVVLGVDAVAHQETLPSPGMKGACNCIPMPQCYKTQTCEPSQRDSGSRNCHVHLHLTSTTRRSGYQAKAMQQSGSLVRNQYVKFNMVTMHKPVAYCCMLVIHLCAHLCGHTGSRNLWSYTSKGSVLGKREICTD